MEDYVSFELAKKLKEKGFDEECLAYYTSEYTLYLNKVVLCDDKYLEVAEIDYEECLRSYNTQKDRWLRTIVDAPTIFQVLKWLRESKRIDSGAVWDNRDGKWVGYINEMDMPDLVGEYVLTNTYDSYEDAAIAGIEYVLEYLL